MRCKPTEWPRQPGPSPAQLQPKPQTPNTKNPCSTLSDTNKPFKGENEIRYDAAKVPYRVHEPAAHAQHLSQLQHPGLKSKLVLNP